MLLDFNLTGGRLRIERPLDWNAGATFALSSSEVPMLPPYARLRWFRRVEPRRPLLVSGLCFAAEGVDARKWADWVAAR